MGVEGQRSDVRRTWEREVKLHGGGKTLRLTLEEGPSMRVVMNYKDSGGPHITPKRRVLSVF